MAAAYDIPTSRERCTTEEQRPRPPSPSRNCTSPSGAKGAERDQLSVGRGETLAVLGRSGTGKSVLLRLIIGLESPTQGSVCIHGEDIAGLTL
jgi:ABC-type transport system involved in cytochrome bd biosynthesis fused ATPase/permease subunit